MATKRIIIKAKIPLGLPDDNLSEDEIFVSGNFIEKIFSATKKPFPEFSSVPFWKIEAEGRSITLIPCGKDFKSMLRYPIINMVPETP